MAAPSLKRFPLTAATITPPSINRQHSHNARPQARKASSTDATTTLANVASRATSPPRRKSEFPPGTSPSPPSKERRVSWEECLRKRDGDGYVSFPDFDELRAKQSECEVR